MTSHHHLILVLLILFIVPTFTLSSQNIVIPSADKVESIEELVVPFIENDNTRAVSIVTYNKGKLTYYNFGTITKNNSLAPNENSLYEIGSISKTFTGTLLAIMSEQGVVNLNDNICNFLPDSIGPWDNEYMITLNDLVTHNSGFPRIPGNLLPHIISNRDNPYSTYSVNDLLSFLKNYSPIMRDNRTPAYSNLGMGLLGHVLASAAGITYEECINRYITNPLEMVSTTISLSESDLIPGHNAQGNITPHWDIPALGGAGAISSNIRDMGIYLSKNMTDASSFYVAQQPLLSFNDNTMIGYAWLTQNDSLSGKDMVWHNGATGGFTSFMGMFKSLEKGVVVLCNSAHNVDLLGVRILQYLSLQP